MGKLPEDDRPLVDRAAELLRGGKLSAAAEVAREAIAADPKNAEAHNTLGTALAQLGDVQGAERAYLVAAQTDPDLYKPHANLANLYAKAGRFDMAAARLRQAVALEPNASRLWLRLGQVLVQLGANAEAEQVYKRTIAFDDNVAARGGLASLYLRLGAPPAALALVKGRDLGSDAVAAAALVEAAYACNDPVLAEAIDKAAPLTFDHDTGVRLAQIALEQARFESAVALARTTRSASADPFDDADVLLEAACLEAAGRHAEAFALIESAFNTRPSVKKAVALADTAQRGGLLTGPGAERAVAAVQAARVLFPDSPDVLVAWGRLSRAQRDYDGAHKSFEAALAMKPDHPAALFGLGVAEATLVPSATAVDLLERASRAAPSDPAPASALLFAELHAGLWTPAERLERHRSFARRYCQVFQTTGPHPARDAGRRLRVGYLSADFRDHALMRFLDAVLAAHDRAKVEVFVYASVATPDAVTRRVQGLDLNYRDIHPLSDAAAARAIANDAIDVLVVLDGHTAGSRLRTVAYRPAPVIVSYLGYPASIGLEAIQYRITDAVADPPGSEPHYEEELVRLGHTAWCFGSGPDISTEREGDGAIRFATFNRSAKLGKPLLACFAKILAGLPGSRLSLKAPTSESARLQERVAAVLGQDLATRVDFVPWTTANDDHLASYRRVDVALDTFPYAGTTTTAEALWMGVPVVTLAGATHVERVGASLLAEVGLERCIATSVDDYVARAIAVAKDEAFRARLRGELRGTMRSRPIADAAAFTRSLEACLTELADRPRPPPSPPGTRVVTTDIGAKIVVPDSLDTATTFVIQEQGRWFEDEVPFVRSLVQPGDVFVDIGANLGVYTTEAAQKASKVVSFEPAGRTAAMLRASIAANHLSNVHLHQVALGGEEGTAQLLLESGPELSRLGTGAGPSEEVAVRTFHSFAEDVRGMTFLKLDAEGSEQAIVEASGDLIRKEAPVVMFELRHLAQLNTGLLGAFEQLGFGLYRLLPGLGIIVPFDRNDEIDTFQLNLFGVAPSRAKELEARGFLAEKPSPEPPVATDEEVAAWAASRPLQMSLGGPALAVSKAVRHLVVAHDPRRAPAERYAAALAAEREGYLDLARSHLPEARLTASRASLDLGWRVRGREALILLDEERWARAQPPASLFACALASYEALPAFDPGIVYRAQAVEAQVVLGAFSSVYQKPGVLDVIEDFYRLRGRSPRMDRRLGLLLAKSRALT